ncbi:MAG TPA: hypothetical protein VIK59_01055, partial [Verrucomicrobiae bacterium]
MLRAKVRKKSIECYHKNKGSRLVKHMQTRYKSNNDNAKPVFSAFPNFCEEIPAFAASVLSGY